MMAAAGCAGNPTQAFSCKMSDSSSDSNPLIEWDSALVFTLQTILANAVTACFGYGCFLILALAAIRVLLHKGLSSIAQRSLLVAVLSFIISSSVFCAASLTHDFAHLASGPYDDNQGAVLLMERIFPIMTVCSRINLLLSDVLVVWRAWVLADHRLMRIVLAVCLAIAAVFTVACIVLVIPDAFQTIIPPRLYLIPLFGNNVIATGVVMYKTWIYRTRIKVDLQQTSQKSQVESVLYLLIESGFIYCGWWIFVTIVIFVRSIPYMVFNVVGCLYPFIAAIYPMLIILVVEHQKSRSGPPSRPFTQSLRFDSPPEQLSNNQGYTDTGISIVQSIVDIQSARSVHQRTTDKPKPDTIDEKDQSTSEVELAV